MDTLKMSEQKNAESGIVPNSAFLSILEYFFKKLKNFSKKKGNIL